MDFVISGKCEFLRKFRAFLNRQYIIFLAWPKTPLFKKEKVQRNLPELKIFWRNFLTYYEVLFHVVLSRSRTHNINFEKLNHCCIRKYISHLLHSSHYIRTDLALYYSCSGKCFSWFGRYFVIRLLVFSNIQSLGAV